jgi:PHD/YefM family antitoxin component YafN of YafNO toxin-antitoxin module
LGQELDSLRAEKDVLYVSKRGRLAGVLIDVDRYADLVDRLEFLEDSLAALQAREELASSLPWTKVRGS